MLAEFINQLNRLYVRGRASRSASYPTASSSEVLRHLPWISCGRRIARFGVRLHLRAPICHNVSIQSAKKINNSVSTYLDCWLVDCRRCRAGGAVKDGIPIFRVMCGVVSAYPLVLSRLAVVNY